VQKKYFHNDKSTNKKVKKVEPLQIINEHLKKKVDINILLNRVKIDQKSETKRQIIFFSLVMLVLSLLGTFVIIIK